LCISFCDTVFSGVAQRLGEAPKVISDQHHQERKKFSVAPAWLRLGGGIARRNEPARQDRSGRAV